MRTLALVSGTLIASIVGLVAVALVADRGVDWPVRSELPAGFRGWAVVQYERRDCAPLARHGLYLVIVHDRSGRACTSSPRPEGWHFHSVQYVGADERRVAVPDDFLHSLSYSVGDMADSFFVGTREDLAADRTPLAERFHRRR